jgi:hypothetical protein
LVVIGWSSGGQSADRTPDRFVVPDEWHPASHA